MASERIDVKHVEPVYVNITSLSMVASYVNQTYFANTVKQKGYAKNVKDKEYVYIMFMSITVNLVEAKESVSITNIEPIAKPAVEKEYVNITGDDMVVKNVRLLLLRKKPKKKPKSNL
jgi:hypothetical protein